MKPPRTNNSYDFKKLKYGKHVFIKSTNPKSARVAAYNYAKERNMRIRVWAHDDCVEIQWY